MIDIDTQASKASWQLLLVTASNINFIVNTRSQIFSLE